MLTAVPVGCTWGCIYFSHYLTYSLLAIVCHCCSLRKPQKVLKMSRSNKPHLFLWPPSAFFSSPSLTHIFFFNLKAYNRICWLESEPYLSIDMKDLFLKVMGYRKGTLLIWYLWQILGIFYFLSGYTLDIL